MEKHWYLANLPHRKLTRLPKMQRDSSVLNFICTKECCNHTFHNKFFFPVNFHVAKVRFLNDSSHKRLKLLHANFLGIFGACACACGPVLVHAMYRVTWTWTCGCQLFFPLADAPASPNRTWSTWWFASIPHHRYLQAIRSFWRAPEMQDYACIIWRWTVLFLSHNCVSSTKMKINEHKFYFSSEIKWASKTMESSQLQAS